MLGWGCRRALDAGVGSLVADTELMEELEQAVAELTQRLAKMREALRLDEQLSDLGELEVAMAAPGFWDRPERAQEVVKEVSKLKRATEPLLKLSVALEDQAEMLVLASEEGDERALREVAADLAPLTAALGVLEFQAKLAGRHDHSSCYLTVHAGAGGTEACDWAQMLLRMYSRWAEDRRMRHEIIDVLSGEEAGVRNATLHVRGEYAYGYLRSELGVHRLVRISPFDAQSRRHTSFAAVDVVPELEDDIDIEVNDNDLRVDTYRAGGAGGQHVNKTDSAVRITHLPSGIVVQCQNERSQHQNRRVALQLLRARLHHLESAKREAELQNAYDNKGEIAWGSQIRSYVLQPYTMVKDHRTGVETGNATAVLDGDIDRFIEGYLSWKMERDA